MTELFHGEESGTSTDNDYSDYSESSDQQELFAPFPSAPSRLGRLDGYAHGILLTGNAAKRVFYPGDAAHLRQRVAFIESTMPHVRTAGTGFFIRKNVLLLAGHTLQDPFSQGKPYKQKIRVLLGKGESINYGGARFRAVHGAYSVKPGLDIAVLLVAPLGDGTTPLPMTMSVYQNSPSVMIAGYGDLLSYHKFPVIDLTYGQGSAAPYKDNGVSKIVYRIDTQQADSGAPIYMMDGSNQPVAVGIHIEGKPPHLQGNVGLAFTTEVIAEIGLLINQSEKGKGNVLIS